MFNNIRKYYNHWRYRLISLFSNDPYLPKIRALEDKIESLQHRPTLQRSPIKYADGMVQPVPVLEMPIYQPMTSATPLPSMVGFRREREQIIHSIGDYIGECYTAINKKEYSKATALYGKIMSAAVAVSFDKKTNKRIEDLKRKYQRTVE